MKECWINVYEPEYSNKACHTCRNDAEHTSKGMKTFYGIKTLYRIHVKLK